MQASGFPDPAFIARATARMLLEIKAVHFRIDPPFTLTSGALSPVYIDCRKLISYPRIRTALMDFGASVVCRDAGFEAFDGVAGGETAGIPFAAWMADRLALPMQYVRKKPKGFGRNAQIEGTFAEGDRILLVEDLATDGGSKFAFADALREAGAQVEHIFVVFFYDIFPEARGKLADYGLQLHSLTSWHAVLEEARSQNLFDSTTLEAVESFLADPKAWQADAATRQQETS